MSIQVKFVFVNDSTKIITVHGQKDFNTFANRVCDFKNIIFDDILIQMDKILYFEEVKK
jgi:hypothetical protein